jgi:hypothetical protein
LDSVKNVIWLRVLIVMPITAMQTVQGQHVKWDLVYLMIENVERIVKLIQHGWVLITVVNVIVASFGCRANRYALSAIIVVRSV